MFVGVAAVIVWIAEWFMDFMNRVETVRFDGDRSATLGVGTVLAALVVVFFLLAIGTYGTDRLPSLVEGGKEAVGKLVTKAK